MGRIFRYVHTASTLDCFLRLGGPEINERLSPGSHPLPHAIPTRTTSIMSAEKPGLPGSHPVTMPLRQTSTSSAMSDDAVPLTDPKNTSELLAERLQAWKHAVGYLEAYVGATEKIQKAHAKEYEKVLKTISDPLKEGHHFDQNLGGIAGLFENMRQNTQGMVNTHIETEKNLKGSVLPILDRLHKEIKNKSKELSGGAGKSAIPVSRANLNQHPTQPIRLPGSLSVSAGKGQYEGRVKDQKGRHQITPLLLLRHIWTHLREGKYTWLSDPEKAAYTLSFPSAEAQTPKPKSSKMLRFRQATFMLLAVAIIAFTVASATGRSDNRIARISISSADRQRFQELLDSVDPSALHNVLHAAEDKYRHGIFKEDRTAMEVVHEENAEVATSLVELAKRHAGNNTTTTVETTSNSVVDPTTTAPGTTSEIPTVDPTTSETTQAPTPTTTPTIAPTVEPTPTTSDTPTTPPTVQPTTQPTTQQPTTPTTQQPTTQAPTTVAPTPSTSAGQSTNGASPTPSSTAGSPTPSSNPPSTSFSSTRGVRSSSTLATEASTDDSPTTTSARSVTQQTIFTTTLANGAVETVTSITVVAGQADQTDGSPARTSTAKGSLQTNGASFKTVGMGGLLGALGMAVAGTL